MDYLILNGKTQDLLIQIKPSEQLTGGKTEAKAAFCFWPGV